MLNSLAFLPLLLSASPQPQVGAPEVRLSLVSDAREVRAGEPFEVAALIELEPDWHVYWKHPGYAGSPTLAALSAPADFVVEGPFYPAPEAIRTPADPTDADGEELVSFGYQRAAALFFRVTPPAHLSAGGEFTLAVSARWLVCKEACFLGSHEAQASFHTGAPGGAGEGAAAVLQRERQRLPRPFDGRARWEGEPSFDAAAELHRARLVLELEGEVLELFPDPSGGFRVTSSEVLRTASGGSTVTLELESRSDPAADPGAAARGLLAVQRADGERFFEFDLRGVRSQDN